MSKKLSYVHAPTWYQHIARLALISMEVLNAAMHMSDSIVLGHSCLVESSIVLVLQGVLNNCRLSHCLSIVVRDSRNHAPSWRQTSSRVMHQWLQGSAYAWTCAALRLAIMNSGTSCSRLTEEVPMTNRPSTIVAASSPVAHSSIWS